MNRALEDVKVVLPRLQRVPELAAGAFSGGHPEGRDALGPAPGHALRA